MVALRSSCEALQALKAKQRLANNPGLGRAAPFVQALSWYIKRLTPQDECEASSPVRACLCRLARPIGAFSRN